MRAFIEYPEVSDERIEITKSEFVVRSKKLSTIRGLEAALEIRDEWAEFDRRLDAGTPVEILTPSQARKMMGLEDPYWKDEC